MPEERTFGRYLIFGGEQYYPTGGWFDFVTSTDDLESAVNQVNLMTNREPVLERVPLGHLPFTLGIRSPWRSTHPWASHSRLTLHRSDSSAGCPGGVPLGEVLASKGASLLCCRIR